MTERAGDTRSERRLRLPGGETVEPTHQEAAILAEILHAVRRIRHGQVQIHIQDGRVVQIDQTEKLRLTSK